MTAPAVYLPAPEVAETATPLILEYHPDLATAPIVYVFRSPALRSRNRIVFGRALRVVGLNAFLVALAAGDTSNDMFEAADRRYGFYVMEIALDEWREASPDHRRALVDHELSHFHVDPDTAELKIRAHDLEEFNQVVYRHGAWSTDVRLFLDACATPA